MREESVVGTVGTDAVSQSGDELDALIDEMDAQICMLGRLFSARHGHGHGHGEAGHRDAGCGLSMAQYMSLRVIATTGPIKMADLAVALGVKPPAVSALVDAAAVAGLVTREPDADDRRITRVALTDAGREALVGAEHQRREQMRHYISVLPIDDVRALIRIQHTLIEAMVSEKI